MMTVFPKTLLSFIFHFLKKQAFSFSFISFAMVFWALNEALFPYFTKILVDTVEQLTPGLASPYKALATPLWGLLICWIVMEVSMRATGIVTIYIWPKFRQNIREAAFAYTQHHSHSFFANNFAGSIANKISELPRACAEIVDVFIMSFLATVLTFVISLVIIFQVNNIFGLIWLVWVAFFMGMTAFYLKRINLASESHAESVSALNGQIVDSLTGIMNVRLFARFRHESRHLGRYQREEIQRAQGAVWALEELNIYRGISSFIFIVVIFLALVHSWNQKWITIGDFSLITMTSFNIMGLVWHCAYDITHVVKEVGTAQASFSLLNIPHEIKNAPHAKTLQVTRGDIVFDNVTFQYKRNANVFKNKSVHIEAGQKVGLVGFSGSGKSTFANLILRFYEINGGRILIDGQDISKVTQESLRSQISMIPQEPILFHRSLIENIRYGRLEATDEEVFEAARRAHCAEFIPQLEQGYDTIVGERGLKLSGGQRQRISIARAILKNAPILVMDEATSALDSETEALIQGSLQGLLKDRTSILIAHRLSTIKDADRILVFDKGEIVEDGSVRRLLRKKGYFAHLWQMQTGGFLPAEGTKEVIP